MAGVAVMTVTWPAVAQIYSCVDASGKRLTSDRPITECANKDQRLLNSDGSVRQIVPPSMTADERADAEAREQQRIADRAAQQDAVRRDRNLLARYPNEAAHNRARAAVLDDVHRSIETSQRRLNELAADRKPLSDEAEFYVGRQLPVKLRQALDLNDASTMAQKTLIQNQQAESTRITTLFDAELARLRRLWAGATPGSLGALPTVPAPAASASASAKASRTSK